MITAAEIRHVEAEIDELNETIQDLSRLLTIAIKKKDPQAAALSDEIDGLVLREIKLRRRKMAIRANSPELRKFSAALAQINAAIEEHLDDLANIKKLIKDAKKVARLADKVLLPMV